MNNSSICPSLGLLVLALLGGGCATDVAAVQQAASMDNCQRVDAVVRDAQTQLAKIRAEMAATRIASAKKEAELQGLRQEVQALRSGSNQVRQIDAEARQTIEALQAELATLRAERDRLAQEKAIGHVDLAKRPTTQPAVVSRAKPQPRQVQDQMKALEASVVALTTQVQQLKQNGEAAIIVKRGDTLFKLARTYKVTVKQIQAANGLDGSLIRVGQRLWIPAATKADGRP